MIRTSPPRDYPEVEGSSGPSSAYDRAQDDIMRAQQRVQEVRVHQKGCDDAIKEAEDQKVGRQYLLDW
jgi:hypothetical protein